MVSKTITKTHHATRTIAYSCPYSHVIEYYHAPQCCNRTPFIQSQPCANTPHATDNPLGLEATHYRLTTSSKEDSKAVGREVCPVCGRSEWEKRWRQRGLRGEENGSSEKRRIEGKEQDASEADVSREADDDSWLLEMPFAQIWEFVNGEWVDRRPYKNMLRGIRLNGRGEEWPCGEYKGFNHGGLR